MDQIDPLIQKSISYLLLIFIITVHEWGHAWLADKCGDPTARLMGRMTWNPIPHLDIFGTVIIPLVMIFMTPGIALLGWGKPVPVNPNNFRHYSRDDVLVSIAGPVSNVVITIAALLLIRIALLTNTDIGVLAAQVILYPLASISLFLGFFNLLPVPPLDGSHLIRPLLSFNARQMYDRFAQYGFIVLLVLINTGVLHPVYRLVEILLRTLTKLFAGI